MPRAKARLYPIAGRPPKDPTKKVGTPVRCLVTFDLAMSLASASDSHGIANPSRGVVSSDIIRLYLYRGLEQDGLMTEEMRDDPTWDTLKEKGLV